MNHLYEQLQQWRTAAAATRYGALQTYLLLDQSVLQGTGITPPTWPLGLSCMILNEDQPAAMFDEASPILLDVSLHTPAEKASASVEKQIEFWLKTCTNANTISYLATGADLPTCATMLRARSQAELPDDMPVLLRYFDTRIATELMTVLDTTQQTVWSSGFAAWHVINRRGQWVKWFDRSAEPTTPDVYLPRLQLNTAQQNKLIAACEVDVVDNQLGEAILEYSVNGKPWAHPADRYEFVKALVDKAEQHGIADTPGHVAYCVLALELGVDFDTKAPWDGHLANMKTNKMTLQQLLETLE